MRKLFLFLSVTISLNLFAQDTALIAPPKEDKGKQWLGILTLTSKFQDDKNWTASDQAIVSEHFKRLVKLNKEGKVILAGRTQLATNDPNMMGLVIFYAKDEKEANNFMQNDPAVKNKIMLAKVLPYGIAVGNFE